MAEQLDEFADEHPEHQQAEERPPRLAVPRFAAFPVQEEQKAIPGERVVGERGQMDRVCTPRLLSDSEISIGHIIQQMAPRRKKYWTNLQM